MASTVSWDSLRELAAFRAEKGRAISIYLNLDPSVSPTAGDTASRINSLLDVGGRSDGVARGDLTHDQRQALREDFDRIRRYFDQEFVRDGSRGAAVFCAGLDDFWRTIALTEPVDDHVRVNRDFYVAPLVPLVGRGEGALVAVVSRERGEVYDLRDGRLEEVAGQFDAQPRRHDQGGWSQARYERHIDELAERHMRDVAAILDAEVRRRRSPPVVLVCSEGNRSAFWDELSHQVQNSVVGWTQAEAHASAPDLLELAAPVLEAWHTAREAEAVERWLEERGRNGRAASGWGQTLEAASDGRVELLLYQDGVSQPAFRCTACGRLSANATRCPLDGSEMERGDDGVDFAIHQALAHGGTVWAVRHRRDLDQAEGIGALLRY